MFIIIITKNNFIIIKMTLCPGTFCPMLHFWWLYVRGLCVRGLYGRGLYVLCCPNWGLYVRGLLVRGLFDRIPSQTWVLHFWHDMGCIHTCLSLLNTLWFCTVSLDSCRYVNFPKGMIKHVLRYRNFTL